MSAMSWKKWMAPLPRLFLGELDEMVTPAQPGAPIGSGSRDLDFVRECVQNLPCSALLKAARYFANLQAGRHSWAIGHFPFRLNSWRCTAVRG